MKAASTPCHSRQVGLLNTTIAEHDVLDIQRLILFTGLALVLVLIWQAWIEYDGKQQPIETLVERVDQSQAVSARPGSSVQPEQDVPSAPAAPDKPAAQAPVLLASALASTNTVTVETDLVRAQIDTYGGDLRHLELLTYPVTLDQPDQPFNLLNDKGADLFVIQGGLLGVQADLPNHHTPYTSERRNYLLTPGADTIEAVLEWQGPESVVYRKVYTFERDSYYITVRYEVTNNGSTPWQGYIYNQILRTEVKEKSSGLGFFGRLPSYTGGVIYTPEDKYQKIDFDDMREANLSRSTPTGWVAMLQHYFVGALLPRGGTAYEFYSNVTARDSQPRYHIGYKSVEPTVVPPGDKGELSARFYVGPKEQHRLVEVDQQLELTVDYGWLTPVSSPLFWLLTNINKVVGNWGVSIILLTLLVKLVFYPLSAASYKSMARMKNLQPRMKTLKERFGDDKQKFQQAMMEMYKKEKINPFGSCLPIVIQIPVFIALYWVLLESVELRQAPFALWIKDLSSQDPYYVLPLLMGASMFGQTLLNPTPVDPMQKNLMMAMPVVFTVFFLWFPAGLVLYWLVNNILSITQQWVITRKIQAAGG